MNCEIYRDLLIPYMEETCSEETSRLVEAHLAQCADCKKELENYREELKTPEESAGKLINPGKPFRKIRRYIVFLWAAIAILILLISHVGSYFAVGKEHGFYVADQKFFHMKEENILGGIQEEFEDIFIKMYGRIYFQIIDRDHYYANQASLGEILEKSDELRNIHFDYANAQIEHYADCDNIDISIPVTAEGDDVQMFMYLSGYREGVGKFRFHTMQISRKDVLELGYCYYPYNTLMSNEFQVWPGTEYFDYSVNALEKHELLVTDRGKQTILTDTQKRIAPGVYRYEDGERFDEITFFEDGTLVRTGDYADKGLPEDNINIMQLISRVNRIIEPVRYFIATTQEGEERIIIASNLELTVDIYGKSFKVIDENHICIGKDQVYEKIR